MSRHDPFALIEGRTTVLRLDGDLPEVTGDGCIDVVIMSNEDGFSPLGAARQDLSRELGVPENVIRALANEYGRKRGQVCLACIANLRDDGKLKGLIMAPGSRSHAYSRYADGEYGTPYRDFYYSVTYSALDFAVRAWDAHGIGCTHLSGSLGFHSDIVHCQVEALAHLCRGGGAPNLKRFAYFGCCITDDHLQDAQAYANDAVLSDHRPISEVSERMHNVTIVTIDWNDQAHPPIEDLT